MRRKVVNAFLFLPSFGQTIRTNSPWSSEPLLKPSRSIVSSPALRRAYLSHHRHSTTMTDQVIHEPSQNRYAIRLEGITEPAVLVYNIQKGNGADVYELTHTYVAPEMRGRGIAGKLVKHAIEHARQNGHKIRPVCSYVVLHMDRHPQDADVLP